MESESKFVADKAEEQPKSKHDSGEDQVNKDEDKNQDESGVENVDKKVENVLPKEVTNQVWYEFIDPSSSKSYYHNYNTKETTWTAPPVFIPHNQVNTVPSTMSANYANAATQFNLAANNGNIADELRAIAYFNSKDGRYTGGSSHWDALGIPQDRSARQLARFVDLKDLEKNREEAKIMRQQVAKSKSKEEWAEYNKQKKDVKRRKNMEWLLKDD